MRRWAPGFRFALSLILILSCPGVSPYSHAARAIVRAPSAARTGAATRPGSIAVRPAPLRASTLGAPLRLTVTPRPSLRASARPAAAATSAAGPAALPAPAASAASAARVPAFRAAAPAAAAAKDGRDADPAASSAASALERAAAKAAPEGGAKLAPAADAESAARTAAAEFDGSAEAFAAPVSPSPARFGRFAGWSRTLGRAPSAGPGLAPWSASLAEPALSDAGAAPAVSAGASSSEGLRERLARKLRGARKTAGIAVFGDPEVRPYLKRHRRSIVLVASLTVLLGLIGIGEAWLWGHFIDAAFTAKDADLAGWWFGAGVALHLVHHQLIGKYKENRLNLLRVGLEQDVREALYAKVHAQGAGFLAAHPSSEVSSRLINNVPQIQNRNVNIPVTLPLHVIMVAATAVMMLQSWPMLTGAVFAFSPLIIWLFIRYGRAQQRNEAAFVAAQARAAKVGEAGLSAQREALLLGAEKRQERLYAEVSREMARGKFRIVRTQVNNDILTGFISYFAAHFLVFLLGFLTFLASGAPSLGTIFSFAGYTMKLREAAHGLLDTTKNYLAAEGQTRTILDWLSAKVRPEASGQAAPLSGGLSLRGVSLGQGRPVDAEFPAGSRTAVVDEAGRSLDGLAELLLQLRQPESGALSYDGRPYAELSGASLRRQVGLLDHRSGFVPGTVADNLRDAKPGASDAELGAALHAAGAMFVLKAGALDMDADKALEAFGEGPMRRVLVARLLLQDPSVVVLAAPEGGLSGAELSAFERSLEGALEGRTVIWLWPGAAAAAKADRVVVLRAEGPARSLSPEQVARDPELKPLLQR